MPTMANITVANAAAANVSFVAKVPSAGDRSPARWTYDAYSTIQGFRPAFSLLTRDNGARNGRVFSASYTHPVLFQDANNAYQIGAKVPLSMTGTLPTNVSAADVYDAYVLFTNLLASTLIRSAASDGYAPT